MNTANMVRKYDYFIDSILGTFSTYDFKDIQRNIQKTIKTMLNRTQRIFKYSNLPESIPARILEQYLQLNGNCFFTVISGTPYVFTGGLGGVPDEYYEPTVYTVANPALNLSENFTIGYDGILIRNDSYMQGLGPIFQKYATQQAVAELSLQMAAINTRIVSLISAPDDRTKDSASNFLNSIIQGDLAVVSENAFLDGIKVQPYANSSASSYIQHIIELLQYSRATWCNEIGLDANYNMKRERLSESEIGTNNDFLNPLIDDMLTCRKLALDAINAKFGYDIQVELDSSWKMNRLEEQVAFNSEDTPDAETESIESPDSPDAETENPESAETVDVNININIDSESDNESEDESDE